MKKSTRESPHRSSAEKAFFASEQTSSSLSAGSAAGIKRSAPSGSFEEYEKVTKLRSKLVIEDGIGYCILDTTDLEEIGMAYDQAKTHVAEFSKIRELKIWAIFARNPESGLYDGSVRSRRPYVINRICDNYNGGGHNNACGVKKLDDNLIKSLLENLSKLVNENVNL